MNLVGNSRIALTHMVKKPLRTFLVLQGIIWAVAVAIFPNSIHEGIKNRAKNKPSEYGLDTVTLHASNDGRNVFTDSDIRAIRSDFPSSDVSNIMPANVSNGMISYKGIEVAIHFIGTDENSPDVRTFYTSKGRYLSRDDVREKRNVCVLEPGISNTLFGDTDPVGKTVKAVFEGREFEFEVIGLMEQRSEERLTTNELGFRSGTKKRLVARIMFMMGLKGYLTEWKRTDTGVHVPISIMHGNSFDWLIVKTDPARATEVAEDLQAYLIKKGKHAQAYANILLPIVSESRLKIQDELTKAVFFVCLLLGGAMITNIMLLSVMERYREIAIRRVEGATKRDIVEQFLTEGAVLCLIATILGIPLGLLMGYIVARIEPWALASVAIPYKKLPFYVLWAVGIGLLAAILPARKAASLDPVKILKSE